MDAAANVCLIDQTLLANAAGLFPLPGTALSQALLQDGLQARLSAAERIGDLELLIKNLILHDSLFIMEANVPPQITELPLRTSLLEAGLVKVLALSQTEASIVSQRVAEALFPEMEGEGRRAESAVYHEAIREVLHPSDRGMTTVNPFEMIVRSLVDDIHNDITYPDTGGASGPSKGDHSPIQSPMRYSALTVRRIGSEGLRQRNGYNWFRKERFDDPQSYFAGVSHLRTIVYWHVASTLSIPFQATGRRAPLMRSFADEEVVTAQAQVYGQVAAAFGISNSDVQASEAPVACYLPPALTLCLDRIRQGMTPVGAIADLRDEFKAMRSELASWQDKLQGNFTVRDHVVAQRQLGELSMELAGRYSTDPTRAVISRMLDSVDSALPIIATPFNPNAYVEAIKSMPVRELKDWWAKRPFRVVFEFGDALSDVRAPSALIKDLLGLQIGPREVRAYRRWLDSSYRAWRTPVFGRVTNS